MSYLYSFNVHFEMFNLMFIRYLGLEDISYLKYFTIAFMNFDTYDGI